MKIQRFAVFFVALTGAGTLYWGLFHPGSQNSVSVIDEKSLAPLGLQASEMGGIKVESQRAIRGAANFLRSAPAPALTQLGFSAHAAKNFGNAISAYSRKAKNAALFNDMFSPDAIESGAAERARISLLQQPAAAVQDVRLIMSELPADADRQRLDLLNFISELPLNDEARQPLKALLIQEMQRQPYQAEDDRTQYPQVLALNLFMIQDIDPASRGQILQSVIENQPDPELKRVFTQFLQTEAPAAPNAQGNDSARDPASLLASSGDGGLSRGTVSSPVNEQTSSQ